MEATKRSWHIGPHYKYDIESRSGHIVSFPMTPQGIENAAHVVRAVNTFEQAKAALGAAIETLAQSPYRTDRTLAELYARVKEVQAAMEAPQ